MVVLNFDHKKILNNNGSFNKRMSPKSPSLDAKTGNSTPVSMTAVAHLVCQPNSHQFEDRSLSLENPVKVGRSVAKAKPTRNNAIFDCKVLSRNHALIWYENGQFFLKDTKSSNGTFINNQRLSKGSEESPPMEISSGDIVQFGVDVVENSRKVTHGCILAAVKLYLPDGNEAKPSQTTLVIPNTGTIPTQDLYTLQNCLQDALRKEQILSNKLASLQQIMLSAQEASKSSWKALIDEDRLLSRIEILEVQLQTYSKNFSEDKLREEIQRLTDEKLKYQEAAKERLEELLQEKLELSKKLHDTERSLYNSNDEYSHLLQVNKQNQEELMELATKHEKQVQQVEELTKIIQDAEKDHTEALEKFEQEKKELEMNLEELRLNESVMCARVESLQADTDFTKEQFQAYKTKVEGSRHNGDLPNVDELNAKNKMIINNQDDIISSDPRVKQLEDEVKSIKEKLEITEKNVLKKNAEVELLQGQLEKAQLEEASMAADQVLVRAHQDDDYTESNGSVSDMTLVSTSDLCLSNDKEEACEQLRKLLIEARSKKTAVEAYLENVEKELCVTRDKVQQTECEAQDLRSQLRVCQQQIKDKCEYVSRLHNQMSVLESSAKEVKDQVLKLKEELLSKQKEADALKKRIHCLEEFRKDDGICVDERAHSSIPGGGESDNYYRLHTAVSDTDNLPNIIHPLSNDNVNRCKSGSSSDSGIVNSEHVVKVVSEECQNLKRKLQENETAMKKYAVENDRLQEEYHKIQESFKDLQSLHDVLKEGGKEDLFSKLEFAHKELIDKSKKLEEAQSELLQVRESFSKVTEERKCLRNELVQIEEQYKLVTYQNQMATACSVIPLLIVLVALVVAFYPTLATITATHGS